MGTNDRKLSMLPRREVLRNTMLLASAGVAVTTCGKASIPKDSVDFHTIPIDQGIQRRWLGSEFWANRLQDWRLDKGMLVCTANGAWDQVRTIGLLTRSLNDKATDAAIRARFHRLSDNAKPGFAGFLFGVGEGLLDYRAAAIAQHGSGHGGGILATVDHKGKLLFRDHSSELDRVSFEKMTPQKATNKNTNYDQFDLELHITPQPDGNFQATQKMYSVQGKILNMAHLPDITPSQVRGGISLVSSTGAAQGGLWGISDISTGGNKISVTPQRALGPVMGCMHSLSGSVLKMSAQLMPLGQQDPKSVQIQFRKTGDTSWQDGPISQISDAYVANFRIEQWQGTLDTEYRVVFEGDDKTLWQGTIRKEPVNSDELKIGLYSCLMATGIRLDGAKDPKLHPKEKHIGRYTHDNIYIPYTNIIKNSTAQNPDILVFCGDQYYEFTPVGPTGNGPNSLLDTLYRWYLWYWSFRDLCRDRPTIMLIDDHDVLQGNLWGQGGRKAPNNKEPNGGYTKNAQLVRAIHHFQCDHNPDPDDPTPIENDIPVYYGDFVYAGVNFAIIEDRKFKTGPSQPAGFDFHQDGTILGERQEKFLEKWAKSHPGLPKIVLSQTPWACVQTNKEGRPKISVDSNGYIRRARNRAVRRVKRAKAIMLAGDQHLATLIRHGVEAYDDGPVQFSGPAGATLFQRWFEPAGNRANAREGVPYSGDFRDAYKNRLRMLAVANPKISHAEHSAEDVSSQSLVDPALKSEGYGLVRINKKAKHFIFECWPSDADPNSADAEQFPGWPYTLKFSDV